MNQRQRECALLRRMIAKYQLTRFQAHAAAMLYAINGLMCAARFCWHFRPEARAQRNGG